MATKKKDYFLRIPVDIYKRGVLIYFGSKSGFMRLIDREAPEYHNGCEEIADDKNNLAIIYKDMDMVIYAKKIPTIKVLLHELFHATCGIMQQVGISLDDESEEAYAYLFEYLCSKTLTWFFEISDNAQ